MSTLPQTLRGTMQMWLVFGVGLLSACGSDTTGPTINNAVAFWQLQLNHHAVTLALTPLYDTVRLVATPLNAAGVPLTDTGTTTYRVTGTKVTVDSAGVLHAVATVSNQKVYAFRTIRGVTQEDSLIVNVNAVATVPVLGVLTFQPVSGSTPFCAVNDSKCLPKMTATATDTGGASISGIAVAFSRADQRWGTGNIVKLSVSATTATVTPLNVGHVVLYAEATVYGRSQRDSLLFTVGSPNFQCVYVVPSTQTGQMTPVAMFDANKVTIGEGGTVLWINLWSGHTVDVVFDTPSAAQSADSAKIAAGAVIPVLGQCTYNAAPATHYFAILPNGGPSGSIPAWPAVDTAKGKDGVGVQARMFPTVGTYPYHSDEYGTTGIVVVTPNN